MRALLLIAIAVHLIACSSDEAQPEPDVERRRELLKPPPPREDPAKLREERRIHDDKGNLIPSGEVVADLELPRGLELRRDDAKNNEWLYVSDKISSEELVRFYKPRLFTGKIDYTLSGAVTFEHASIKDRPKTLPVTVRIAKMLGSQKASSLLIERHVPMPKKEWPDQAKAEAQLKARRMWAD